METTENLATVTMTSISNVKYDLVERIIEAVILAVICVVAVTGNVLLWIVIFRRKSLRTNSNALILCLSCADILVAVVNMPFTIYTILIGEWMFSDMLCVFFGTLNMVTFIASVMSLAAISINRYILIVHANKFREVFTKRNTAFFIAGVWILSGALASPPLLGWASYGYLEGQSFCFCSWTESISYTFFMVVVCFGGPCSVMTYCYTKILCVFKKSQRNISQSTRKRRGSASGVKDNCIIKFRAKLEPNHKRRRSLPLEKSRSKSDDRNLSNKLDCDDYGNGRVVRLASTGMVRKNRPVTFLPLNIQTSTMVSSNTNNAVQRSNSSISPQESSSDDKVLEKGSYSPPTYPEYIKRDTSLDYRGSKKWKSLFKTSITGKDSLGDSEIQVEAVSADEFSNPFANSISVSELASQSTPKGRRRNAPAGLYGTPNGPSASRIARKKKRREEEMRLTKSFMVVICAFILCWFPFCITMFWSVFIKDDRNSVPRPIDTGSLLLGFANSCCNPIIYGVMNRKFRAGFKSLLCWWKDHNTVNPWKPPVQQP